MESIENRIAELETRVAFQEDALQTLNEQLAHQQKLTGQQQQMLQTVYRQLLELRTLSDNDGSTQEMQEKPPHY
ncbi:MAG TPA: SlyX family protein [Pseudomonadales bacterium]|nr:SlyX family protein [Pseudomonadales bacterium]